MSTNKFGKEEKRTDFFKLARNLIESGYEIEGLLLILSTWNFAIFRYAVKEFDIDIFSKQIKKIKPNFYNICGNFRFIDFDSYVTDIKIIYETLSDIEGIKNTGASKLMHLMKPEVFIMWDGYIRGDKPQKHYKELEIYKKGEYVYKKYNKDFEGYIEFLKDMQSKFKHLNTKGKKPLTKAVDEFNYVNITLPYQQIEKQIKINKRKIL